jgi:hypothetical protein
MKRLIDANVLVVGLLEVHSAPTRVTLYLKKFQSKAAEALRSSHSFAEAYAVLMSLPLSP